MGGAFLDSRGFVFCGSDHPIEKDDAPPAGCNRRVVERPVMTFPLFWSAPEEYALELMDACIDAILRCSNKEVKSPVASGVDWIRLSDQKKFLRLISTRCDSTTLDDLVDEGGRDRLTSRRCNQK